jgi:UTP--glucose-1-phosphate uridylyltransferase
MRIRKAVITSAAPTQRSLPLQRFVDRDGVDKAALKIIIEEVVSAGVEEIAVVICPGDQHVYLQAAEEHAPRLHLVEQADPRGYGDALHRAAAFIGHEPFVHLVGDHLYISRSDQRCAQQLVEVAGAESCSLSAVQPTREAMLPYYGVVGGRRVQGRNSLYEVERVVEKPTPTEAEQKLIVPGLRAGHYLCLFGMHVLSPLVFEVLGEQIAAAAPGQSIALSPALAKICERERHLALEVAGDRYNIGVKYGLLTAQLALALAGKDRHDVLAQLVELPAGSRVG